MIINSISYQIAQDFGYTPDIDKDSVKFLEMQNGDIQIVNFGSRKEILAEFTVAFLTIAEQVALLNYLKTNIGQKIQIQEENDQEKIFIEAWSPTSYYVRVLAVSEIEEPVFSPNHETLQLRVHVALCGENSTDEYNSADSSLIDVLLTVDTVKAAYSQISTPPTSGIDLNTRWYKSDDRTVHQFDGTNWDTVLFTVPADDTSLGFIDGIFYWSCFSDISQDIPNGIPQNFISGMINARSLSPSSKSINLKKGPAVAFKNGFSFNINNAERFWLWVLNNGIPVLNANVTLESFKAGTPPTINKISTGKNASNSFDISEYEFQVEPFSLNSNPVFTDRSIQDEIINGTDGRYVGVKPEQIGKMPIVTYGEWEMAKLQDISKNKIVISAGREDPDITQAQLSTVQHFIGEIQTGNNLLIHINKYSGGAGDEFKYEISTEDWAAIQANPRNYSIKILSDTHTGDKDNEGKIRRIDTATESGTDYILTLVEALPVAPTSGDTIVFQMFRNVFQHQINEDASGGFGDLLSGGWIDVIRLWTIQDNELVELPNTGYTVIEPDKNIVELDPQTSGDESEVGVFAKIEQSPPTFPLNLAPITNSSDEMQFTDSGGNINATLGTPPYWIEDGGYEFQNHEKAYIVTGELNLGRGVSPNLADPNNDNFPRSSYVYVAFCDWLYWNYPLYAYAKWADPCLSYEDVSDVEVNFGVKKYANITTLSHANYEWGDYRALKENVQILAFELPINHDTNLENEYIDQQVLMCIALEINTQNRTRSERSGNNFLMQMASPFRIVMRFRLKNGNYITNSNWEYSFTAKELGPQTDESTDGQGKIIIDNRPGSNGFINENTTLTDNWDFVINRVVDNISSRDFLVTSGEVTQGFTVWIRTIPGARVDRWMDGAWSEGVETISLGQKVLELRNLYDKTSGSGISDILHTVISGDDDFALQNTYDENNRHPDVKLQGRELFDLSQFFASTNTWSDVEAMEILIVNENLENVYNTASGETSNFNFKYCRTRYQVHLYEAPALYSAQNIKFTNVQLFSGVRGKNISGYTFPTRAKGIVSDILNTIYPNQYDTNALDTLMAQSGRESWNFRRQFSEQMEGDAVLNELATNLWAAVIFNENDQIEFKSLNPNDYSLGTPQFTFTDAEIIRGSLTKPKMRQPHEIYQDFTFAFNYYPPSEFSNVFKKWQVEQAINQNNVSAELSYDLRTSIIQAGGLNKLRKEFIYHYEGSTLPMADWIVQWFLFNSWEQKFKVNIDYIIGSNPVKLMDYIAVNTYAFQNNIAMEGFCSHVKPNFYEGYVELGIYAFRPPGYRGPLCDPFNDALTFPRDTTGWTEGNGKINSAPDFGGDRDTGTTLKDAGAYPRIIQC